MRNHTLRVCQVAIALAMLFGTILHPNRASVALAQDNDFFISVSGPSRIAPGGNITYEFTVENLRDAEITELSFFSKIPANTTHVSGGTHDTNANHSVFSLASLSANATANFSLVVKVGNNVANDTDILLDWQDFEATDWFVDGASGQYSRSDGVHTIVEAPGTLVAILKHNGKAFDVNVDGFKFENFSNDSHTWQDDLGADDVFNLFGPVSCETGNTAETCKLTTTAEKWRLNTIKDMGLGHCDGMASSSLSLFTQTPFKGISKASDLQPGASHNINLNFPGKDIENYIVGQMAFQYTWEYGDEVITKKPSELVSDLTAAFNASPSTAYELTIFKLDHSGGHAITPYGIEKVTDNEWRILVYDNNFPKQRQFVTVKKTGTTESWRYTTASTPGEAPDVYIGTEKSNTLHIVPNSLRSYGYYGEGTYFDCKFCPSKSSTASAQAASNGQATEMQIDGTLEVQYIGEGAILVVNDEGQKTGDDPVSKTFVDEIPDTDIHHHRGGLGKEVPPTIVFPFSETDETYYTVIVHGETVSNTTAGSLNLTGPGFVIGVNDIELDPGEQFEFTVSPDGDHISFESTENMVAPELYIAHDPAIEGNPSVIFDIEGVTLVPGEKVSLDLDPVREHFIFNHSGPEAEDFIVDMMHVWPDGDEEDYSETIELPASANAASIDFGAWDGLSHPPIYFDDELQNPSVNHRLKLESSSRSYDSTPQEGAPAGVYTIEATFTNVTEVQLSDLYFTVANLTDGNVLLNADGGPASTDAKLSVASTDLGDDGILHVNESVTVSFEIGLAQTGSSDFTVDANGVPHDWTHEAPELAGEANDASFDFTVDANAGSTIFLPFLAK